MHTYISIYTYIHTYINTYITLRYNTLHYIALITLHYIHYITLHYITLHCIALHCIALHCITLHTYIIYIHIIYIYTYPLTFPWFSKGFFHHADASSPWVLVFWCFFVKAMGSTPRYGHLNGEMIWNDDQQLDLLITDFVIPIKKP